MEVFAIQEWIISEESKTKYALAKSDIWTFGWVETSLSGSGGSEDSNNNSEEFIPFAYVAEWILAHGRWQGLFVQKNGPRPKILTHQLDSFPGARAGPNLGVKTCFAAMPNAKPSSNKFTPISSYRAIVIHDSTSMYAVMR